MAHRTRRSRLATLLTALLLLPLAACGSGGSAKSDHQIKVWIEEDLPERVQATQKIVDAFTKESGIKVKLVPVGEDQFNQVLTSSAAAGDLPDVVGGLPLGQLHTMSGNDLIDTDSVGKVLSALDPATFSKSALDLTTDHGKPIAIPSESWVMLLLYRKDLFAKAGLKTPTSYADILAAAKKLDQPKTAGFVAGDVAGDAFTEQSFEEVGLANGCQLVDDKGKVQFGSPACVQALDFYGELMKNYSASGAQDVDTTRAAYFSGQAGMLLWSTFVLDELAGLRKDAMPSCPQCKSDPTFLAKNSGVVTALQGPSGSAPATFGEITSWTVTKGASADPARKFVEYMMNAGYEPWLSIAPEGKVPVRTGSKSGSTEFTDAWSKMPIGVDTKAPMSQFYGHDVIDALTTGVDHLSRWGFSEGQGDLIGAIQGQQPVAKAVNEVSNGTSAEKAAKEAADAIRAVQGSQ